MLQSQFWILCAVTMLAPHTPPRWSLAIAVTYLVVAFLTFQQEGKKMNMSYCRFQNTVTDLADCMDALQEIDYDLTKLSADEEKAARRLIEICKVIGGQDDHQ